MGALDNFSCPVSPLYVPLQRAVFWWNISAILRTVWDALKKNYFCPCLAEYGIFVRPPREAPNMGKFADCSWLCPVYGIDTVTLTWAPLAQSRSKVPIIHVCFIMQPACKVHFIFCHIQIWTRTLQCELFRGYFVFCTYNLKWKPLFDGSILSVLDI